ncbi:MAG TPA: hypothetical protein VF746_23240 [Longimicrobium sp.]|jgi:hypothetical protein
MTTHTRLFAAAALAAAGTGGAAPALLPASIGEGAGPQPVLYGSLDQSEDGERPCILCAGKACAPCYHLQPETSP